MTVKRQRHGRAPLSENTDRGVVERVYHGFGQQILAYLHYTVISGLPADFFLRSVVFHFQKRLEKEVTLKQVEEKLTFFWENCRALNRRNKGWKELLRLGIDGLPRLDEDKIAWVKARACELEELVDTEKTRRLLRSAFQSPSPLRAGCKRKSVTPSAHVRNKTPRRETGGPLSRVNSHKSASAVCANIVVTKPPHFKLEVPLPTNRQRQQATPRRECADSEGDSESDSESGRHSGSLPSRRQRCLSVATQATSTFENVLLDKAGTLHEFCLKCARTTSPDNDTKAEARTAQLLSELEATKSRVSQLDIELDDSKYQEAETMRRLNALSSDYDEQLRGNKHLQTFVAAKDYNGIVNDNAALRVENDRLRNRIVMFEASLQFMPSSWGIPQNESVGKILYDMEELYSMLKRLMPALDIMFSMPKKDIDEQSALAKLSRRALGLSDVAMGQNWTSTLQLSRFKLREILISLVSAALCLWVFDANVEALFTNNSPAYAQLTALLSGHDEESTERLKFAAHKRCIEDSYFQDEVIPQRARYQSRCFFHAIRPLLDAQHDHEAEMLLEHAIWAAEGEALTEIFTAALRIKVRLLLTTDSFLCSFPVPGTPFDEHSMRRWNDEHSPERNGEAVEEVGIAMFPALSRYRVNRRAFSYNRFVSATPTPEAHGSPRLRNAIVLTR